VRTASDVFYDHFEIALVGVAATRVRYVQQYPALAKRAFLNLRMPVRQPNVTDAGDFRAGRTYAFPFLFVVPQQLPLGACGHDCTRSTVQAHHLRLPPSLGGWIGDDFSPKVATVQYAIVARAKIPCGSGLANSVEGFQRLQILPAAPPEPPLHIESGDANYILCASKSTRKKLSFRKYGAVVARGFQPKAVMQSLDGRGAAGTSCQVHLEFTPVAFATRPPRILAMRGKLISHTLFSTWPLKDFPDLGHASGHERYPTLDYKAIASSVSFTLSNVAWTPQTTTMEKRKQRHLQTSPEPVRRAKGQRSHFQGEEDCWESVERMPVSYEAVLHIPIPATDADKVLVPTFHSCTVSRVYTLDIKLFIGSTAKPLALRLPVQVGVDLPPYPQADVEMPVLEDYDSLVRGF